ncbi:MAG: hypothetical protein AB7F19_04385 [Candidatus Babeliales bacterium]
MAYGNVNELDVAYYYFNFVEQHATPNTVVQDYAKRQLKLFAQLKLTTQPVIDKPEAQPNANITPELEGSARSLLKRPMQKSMDEFK